MEIQAIGIDLGKTLFHVAAVDANGSVVVRKRCSRTQLTYTANVRVRVIGMEACGGPYISSDGLCGSRATRCDSRRRLRRPGNRQ